MRQVFFLLPDPLRQRLLWSAGTWMERLGGKSGCVSAARRRRGSGGRVRLCLDEVVLLPDLYGDKLCAALDRQHPRDLFDVKLLLDQDGLDVAPSKAFWSICSVIRNL